MRQQPLGTVVAICPWNYPLVLAIGKIAAALITGNCVIVKPSPFTPYSILKFVELVRHIFPAGVLQALNGDGTLGPILCNHSGVDKISFTGSVATGKKLAANAARSLKSVTLELGGNNASIVCSDVDVGAVAPQVAAGAFANSGQLCVASKRIYVHEDIYDEFLSVIVETVKSWTVAPTTGGQEGVMLGPVQNETQHGVVKQIFEDTRRNGYRFALGSDVGDPGTSLVIQPAIIDDPPDNALVVTAEAFGKTVACCKVFYR